MKGETFGIISFFVVLAALAFGFIVLPFGLYGITYSLLLNTATGLFGTTWILIAGNKITKKIKGERDEK